MDRFIRLDELMEIIGVRKSTVYSWMKENGPHYDPEFPRPRRLGNRSVAWLESEVEDWMNSREVVEASPPWWWCRWLRIRLWWMRRKLGVEDLVDEYKDEEEGSVVPQKHHKNTRRRLAEKEAGGAV